MDAHAGSGTRVNGQQEDIGPTGTCGGDHSLAESEFHLPRL
jgi:hypothetical protein